MKSYVIGILFCCGILGAIAAWAAQGDDAAPASQIEALTRQVKALEKRVEALEKQSQQRQFRGIIPAPSPRLPGRQAPENWQQREFNGMPYYVVPIDKDANSVPALRK